MPWSGKRISATALVIGSMAPDFEFFFRMRAETDISHTWQGAVLFDLPVTLLVAFAYHGWIRRPLLTNLPLFLQKRVSVFDAFDWTTYVWKHWLAVLLSAMLGIASHFFCDAFTHAYGWFVHRIPVLTANFAFFGKNVPLFHDLQYLSSLVMGLVLVLVLYRLPKQKLSPAKGAPTLFWGAATGVFLIVLAIRFAVTDKVIAGDDIIMSIMGCGIIAVVLVASAFRIKQPSSLP